MAQQTLFEFLTRTEIPSIPIREDAERTGNTRNQAYPLYSAHPVLWSNFFSYHTIMQSRYAPILFNNNVVKDPVTSPAKAVKGEPSVTARLVVYVLKRMTRGLRNSTPLPRNHTQVAMDTGDMASFELSRAQPDLVGYVGRSRDAVLRLPGDIKCSWKWHSTWVQATQVPELEDEFKAVVAQLNYYMNEAGSRYGYVLTDTELVLFRKRDNHFASHIEMAPGIPLTRHDSMGAFTQQSGQLTALLALWYVHMLVSDDDNWCVRGTTSDPEEDTDTSGNFE